MPGSKVLVFGATGPAGICLLRELLHRNHATLAYVRSPSKIPEDIVSNPLLEVVKGEISDTEALTNVVSRSYIIVSLLGPNSLLHTKAATYSDFYVDLFSTMRQQNVRRIFAMSTLSYAQPEDKFSLARLLIVMLIFVVANIGWQSVRRIGRVFEEHGDGLDWTVFRITGIPGGSDEKSWREDREDGEAFEGYIGEKGWTVAQKRAALARWLVDAVEDGKPQWIRKMPAVSRRAGSKAKAT